MSLKMYSDSECLIELTDNDLKMAHNGFTGGAEYLIFYLKNIDAASFNFSNVKIKIANTTLTEYEFKGYVGNEVLSEQEWSEIDSPQDDSTIAAIASVSNGFVYKVTVRCYLSAGNAPECYYNSELNVRIEATKTNLQ